MHWLDRVLAACAWASGALLIFMLVSINFEVAMRYFFKSPTRWVFDFNEYALFYIIFLSAGWSLAKGHFVSVDLVVHALPERVRLWLGAVTSLTAAAVSGILTTYGAELVWDAYRSGTFFHRSLLFPQWPVLAVLPFGSAMMMLVLLRNAWSFATGRAPEHSQESGVGADH